MNPGLSSWAYLFGEFDYNVTPLAPPGSRVVMHNKPEIRGSWDPREIQAFYVGPAIDHYRCVTVFDPTTRRTKTTDTITFVPLSISIPTVNAKDHIIKVVNDLIHLMKNDDKPSLHLEFDDPTKKAIQRIAKSL